MTPFFVGKSVAVTGGLGLIGSFLCDELLAAGARVILADDESKGSWRYCGHLAGKVDYRKGDLQDPSFALAALDDAEIVFHLASRAYGIGYSSAHHLEMFRHNDSINTSVFDAIAQHRPKAVLAVSSSCVYPDDGPTPMSDRLPYTGDPELVNWGYGMAKRMLEEKARVYSRECKVPVTVVRPFNIFGERYNWVGQNSQAIPMLVHRIVSGENPVVVWGSGNQMRNYLHASDCAKIMCRLVERGWDRQPVNIGFEDTVTMRELVETIASAAGLNPEIQFDLTKPEGRLVKSGDSTLLREALGESMPDLLPFPNGIARMIGWYRDTFH